MEGQGAALAAARRGELDDARGRFAALAADLRAATSSRRLLLLGRALVDPAEAYLRYRKGALGAARALLLGATAADAELVADHGFTLLAAHRLQLAVNLVRLEARAGALDEALALAGAFLDHLELRSPAPPQLACARACLDTVPVEILSWYFDKFTGEAALALAHHPAGAAEAFPAVAHHAGHRSAFGSSGHLWLRAYRAGLEDRPEVFLDGMLETMRRGPARDRPLWDAALLEVAAHCRAAGHVELAERVAGHSEAAAVT
jgi:hypothetical protein